MWGPFARWLAADHPDDVIIMFTTAWRDTCTEEAVSLGAAHS
jgi:hypothetical protein